ncbi:adenylate/guanylate cyclase domain-containing protein [Mycobacterium shigaense]|uniref:Adenylate/guanylate cyclase domain-containing protein n=2 Tax=Mycobacterium shigaense TaxID=722731 RepID=A0A1Z4EHZ0_9MYCO|nr:adenylate/guanylate cyclase domain-containing protein [Mycobacterium shigaense]BAX92584.1 adenylate/guanylate cyclase domain-containing protein [Mycobacterium shigaense]
MPGRHSDEPMGFLIVNDGGSERNVPIYDQMFVGRECAGINESRRLVIRDPEISRNHLEVRLDAVADQAFVIDTSTNGTLLNGMRLERAVPRPIRPGDEIRIGDVAMTFHSQRFTAVEPAEMPGVTRTRISQTAMVMVVGDIVNYSTISEVTDEQVIAQSLHTLWHEVGGVLQAHRGTLNHYAGDAIFAIWEANRFPDAGQRAIDFALAANALVDTLGPRLPLRSPDGSPIRMGWGVVVGTVALAAMTRSVEAVIGDSTNVAFRLSGLAGRQGRASVMATTGVRRTAEAHFVWGEGEQVELKGRRGKETVFPVLGRQTVGSDTAPGRSDVVTQDVVRPEVDSEPAAHTPVRNRD